MPEQPKRCFVGHELHHWPNFDLLIVDSALPDQNRTENFVIVGKVTLTGVVRTVKGVLPIALRAKADDKIGLLVPKDNAAEAAVVKGLQVIPIQNLREAVGFLEGEVKISPTRVDLAALFDQRHEDELDFADVKGQESVKRALEIAAAGGHNVLLIGPPGTGKLMLTKRLPTILPPLTLEEALETTKIHSIVGLLAPGQALITQRPFCAPHHTPREIQNYLNRISGPLLDRIDIHVEVPAVKFREFTAERTGETSAQIRERVVAARRRQQERCAGNIDGLIDEQRFLSPSEQTTEPILNPASPGIQTSDG